MISMLAETTRLTPRSDAGVRHFPAHGLAHRPLRGVESFGYAIPPPISVIIVIASPKSAGLRIYNEVAGLLILYAHNLVVASFVLDQDTRPAIGRQFLPDRIFTDRPAAGDENRTFAAIPNEIKFNLHRRGDHEQDTYNCPYDDSVSHPRSPWNLDQQNTRGLKQF
jgi:hypothetical protein